MPSRPSDPCADHPPCDMCVLCRRGRCCKRDLPTYSLPKVGTWPGPVYGDLGVLVVDPSGARVQCHQCGRFFVRLGWHTFWEHATTAQEYRALFGLKQSTALAGPLYRDAVRAESADRLARIRPSQTPVQKLTPEQRSALKAGTAWPLETLLDPHYKEAMKHVGEMTTARARLWPCGCGCGAMLPPGNGPHRGQRYLRGHAPPPLADRVLAQMRARLADTGLALRPPEVAQALDERDDEVRRALGALVRQGQVERRGRGRYALAPATGDGRQGAGA